MPFTTPAPAVIPPGVTVEYVAPRPRSFKPGVTIRDRDLVVSWRGEEEDVLLNLGHADCRYKGIITGASATVTIAAWHDNCGASPRVLLSAAGASRPVRVTVRQTWGEGPPAPEPVEDPAIAVDPAGLSCTLDGVPVDVVLVPYDPLTILQRRRVFRVLLGPVTP